MRLSDDEAKQTIFGQLGVGVHKQSIAEMAHTKVVAKLVFMKREKRGRGVDFQDYCIFDSDIGTKVQWNCHDFVNDRQ